MSKEHGNEDDAYPTPIVGRASHYPAPIDPVTVPDELDHKIDWIIADQQETIGKVLLRKRIKAFVQEYGRQERADQIGRDLFLITDPKTPKVTAVKWMKEQRAELTTTNEEVKDGKD